MTTPTPQGPGPDDFRVPPPPPIESKPGGYAIYRGAFRDWRDDETFEQYARRIGLQRSQIITDRPRPAVGPIAVAFVMVVALVGGLTVAAVLWAVLG